MCAAGSRYHFKRAIGINERSTVRIFDRTVLLLVLVLVLVLLVLLVLVLVLLLVLLVLVLVLLLLLLVEVGVALLSVMLWRLIWPYPEAEARDIVTEVGTFDEGGVQVMAPGVLASLLVFNVAVPEQAFPSVAIGKSEATLEPPKVPAVACTIPEVNALAKLMVRAAPP